MATLIHLNESKLMEYYEKMMDEVYLTHFSFPSNLPHLPINDSEMGEMIYYEAMARGLADQLPKNKGGKSKRVNLHSDPKYSNGLRRRR